MTGVGRLAGSLVDESLTYRGGKDRLYPKTASDIDYGLADNQKDIVWDRYDSFSQVASPDIKKYELGVDLDLNKKGIEGYRNQVKFGGILSLK